MILKRKLFNYFTNKAIKKLADRINNPSEEDEGVIKKLIGKSRENNTPIIVDKNSKKVAITTEPEFLSEELPDSMKNKKEIIDKIKGSGAKATVVLDDHALNNPEVVAHELGHAYYMSGKGNIISRAAHKRGSRTKGFQVGRHIASVGGGAALGYGIGGKHMGLAVLGGAALGGLGAAPELIREGSANIKGYKYLKESGANKNQLDSAKKLYNNQFAGYATSKHNLIPVITGASSALVGSLARKYKDKKDKDKKKNNK